jgi:hypothetical protein
MRHNPSLPDDNDEDDDSDWEDNMDPITFMRHMAAGNPHSIFIQVLEDHDRLKRARLESEISSWAARIVDAAGDPPIEKNSDHGLSDSCNSE